MAERYLGEGDGTIALRLVSGNRMTGHISAGLWPSAESPINLFAGGQCVSTSNMTETT
jgi:hypothetical protein